MYNSAPIALSEVDDSHFRYPQQ